MDGVEKRHGAHLPHWRLADGTYFVTFRLADSLPAAVVAEYRERLAAAINTVRTKQSRPPTQAEVDAIKRRILKSVEDLLDTGIGSCLLRTPGHANLVAEALRFFDGERYNLMAWCVMPNHVHAVVQPNLGVDLSEILHSWKSYTAHNLPPVRKGKTWETESFDHLVRSGEKLLGFVRYTLDNPAKARIRDWPWVGCKQELLDEAS